MVDVGISIDLFPFQEQAVLKLLDFVTNPTSKQTITVKSPTGSGKTIILIDFVDKYLSDVSGDTAFIWLCPGKGNLEEQSREKMRKYANFRDTQNLFEALNSGFVGGTTTFINWELVTKKGNTALRDGERKNLFERIDEARRSGIDFIVIIDEEHSNNTSKANDIINAYTAKHIIRVSATAVQNSKNEYFEIDESDVIEAGLIAKALYVNEGITDNMVIDDDYDCLLELANAKRKEIAQRYIDIGKHIHPLVLIQFPNGQPETIAAVEAKLESMGYTYDNGMVSKWMSEDKRDLPENLTENDATPVFLLMKQAISTGWDCPRAKILVKLREGMQEDFEIQTIGRIRRMPEAKHYDDDLLDFCYVYTFDEKYKNGLLAGVDKAYEIRRLFLKDKCKTFTLEKETRDSGMDGLGGRDVLIKIYDFLKAKYRLTDDKEYNKRIFQENGYVFGNEIIGHALHGEFVHIERVMSSTDYYTTRKRVNIRKHSLEILHSIETIKGSISMNTTTVKVILERLFRKQRNFNNQKVLSLPNDEFSAFIINNKDLIKRDFREVTAEMEEQYSLEMNPKKSAFHIPEQDFYRYDPTVKDETDYLSNAYENYTSGYATSMVRSTSEMLFEQYCESRDTIDWVYKNGDTGQQYFSVVYVDGLRNQWLFYADYIVMMKDGTVWIIETKGGESHGENKNIDRQIGNKFNAFKKYAEGKDIKWGFVRDKDNKLYINNTEFSIDMSNEHWVSLDTAF